MAVTGCKLLEMALVALVAGNGWIWLDAAGNGWKQLLTAEMAGKAANCLIQFFFFNAKKLLVLAVNGCKWLEWPEMALIACKSL